MLVLSCSISLAVLWSQHSAEDKIHNFRKRSNSSYLAAIRSAACKVPLPGLKGKAGGCEKPGQISLSVTHCFVIFCNFVSYYSSICELSD